MYQQRQLLKTYICERLFLEPLEYIYTDTSSYTYTIRILHDGCFLRNNHIFAKDSRIFSKICVPINVILAILLEHNAHFSDQFVCIFWALLLHLVNEISDFIVNRFASSKVNFVAEFISSFLR